MHSCLEANDFPTLSMFIITEQCFVFSTKIIFDCEQKNSCYFVTKSKIIFSLPERLTSGDIKTTKASAASKGLDTNQVFFYLADQCQFHAGFQTGSIAFIRVNMHFQRILFVDSD